jgi:hypothetical protein
MDNKRSLTNGPDFVKGIASGHSLMNDGGNGSSSINDPKPPSGGTTSEGDN